MRLWKAFERSVWRPVKELCYSSDPQTRDTLFQGKSEEVGLFYNCSTNQSDGPRSSLSRPPLNCTSAPPANRPSRPFTRPTFQDVLKLAEQPIFWFDVLSKVSRHAQPHVTHCLPIFIPSPRLFSFFLSVFPTRFIRSPPCAGFCRRVRCRKRPLGAGPSLTLLATAAGDRVPRW